MRPSSRRAAIAVPAALLAAACTQSPDANVAAEPGLTPDSVAWALRGDAPDAPVMLLYRTRHAERDSVTFRTEVAARIEPLGFAFRPAGYAASRGDLVVIPCFSDRCPDQPAGPDQVTGPRYVFQHTGADAAR